MYSDITIRIFFIWIFILLWRAVALQATVMERPSPPDHRHKDRTTEPPQTGVQEESTMALAIKLAEEAAREMRNKQKMQQVPTTTSSPDITTEAITTQPNTTAKQPTNVQSEVTKPKGPKAKTKDNSQEKAKPLKFVPNDMKVQKVVESVPVNPVQQQGKSQTTKQKSVPDNLIPEPSNTPSKVQEGKPRKISETMEKKTGSPKINSNQPQQANTETVLKETHQNNLLFLKNATREAEDLQQRLRQHKLTLKSYIDTLKSVTTVETENNKQSQKNYTNSIRNKVNDILNPKNHMEHVEQKPKEKETPKDSKHPDPNTRHGLTKNIPDTLRARVDVNSLKKSEAFWEMKGGQDVELSVSSDQLKLELEKEQLRTEDELMVDMLAEDYSEVRDSPEVLREDLLDDREANVTPEGSSTEINLQTDNIKASTHHEMFLLSQIVSGRIHGNILAPPPERCSVQANMKRYRPPEESMVATDSLLYRVDLQPEMDLALEGGPMDYLRDYKNPCWLSKITDDKGSLWYDYSESGLTYKRMSFLFEMRLSKGNNWRMRCLPSVFLVGITKSGTTDLYSRIMGHPDIMRPGHKEPMWWNRLTLGMAQSLRKSFRYYLDFFDEAAELIRRKVVIKNNKPYHPGITVDATPANLWDYDCWTDIPGNKGLAEPKYILAHSLKKLIPNAKIVIILREPTNRLYSQYRMKSHNEPATTFHKQVMEAIFNFNQCLETRTLRSCAYDFDISKHEFGFPGGVFLRASLYYVFIKDWLDVFPRDQLMILRAEDYHNDTAKSLVDVFNFLGVSSLGEERLHAISRQRSVNTRTDHIDRSLEPMLPETERLLRDFFRPYNRKLAKLLNDKRFRWANVQEDVLTF